MVDRQTLSLLKYPDDLKFPLSKEMAVYYLKMGYRIVVRDNKVKGFYVCCNYEPNRKSYLQSLHRDWQHLLYKFPILTRRNIRTLLRANYVSFLNNPIGIIEDDLC